MQIPGADVVPIHVLGAMDTELSRVSTSELMNYALTNLFDVSKEGGYAVRHSMRPIDDFGENARQTGNMNPLAAAFPILFPYGFGGIEAERQTKVNLRDHARWALQYYDCRFATHHSFPFVAFALIQKREAMRSARLQMRRKDFEKDALALCSITVKDLKQAEAEERRKESISNPRVRALRKHVIAANGKVIGSDNARAQYRGMIWGTCLFHAGPTIWITINPADIHDPIAQVFAGENIEMDKFNSLLGPNSQHRAENIASNPYAAARYFDFIVRTTLQTLMGITNHGSRVTCEKGILGQATAYFGVVEAQGRGTLHLHMLMWLAGTPNSKEMEVALKSGTVRQYIQTNVRAHLDDLTEKDIKNMVRQPQLAYSRPPDPHHEGWGESNHKFERQLARSQQVHTCSRTSCLRLTKGKWTCKRRAPWTLSEDDYVDERGNWSPKRTYGYINSYCPTILTSLRCNNDIKINTNGSDTKDVAFYITAYATKKQKKTHNLSALMATALPYHNDNPRYEDIRERNRLLVYRCLNVINRETELSGPQVAAYLMGYGDTYTSHHYTPLYTSLFFGTLKHMFPSIVGDKGQSR